MAFIEHLMNSDRERLLAEAKIVYLEPGEHLIRRGADGGDIYMVESGRLEVVDTRQNPERVLHVLGAGRMVGELSFVDQAPRTMDVRAVDVCLIRHWSRGDLLRVLESDVALSARFYSALSIAVTDRLRTNGAQGTSGQRSSANLVMGGVTVAVAEEARAIAAGPRAAWAAFDKAAGDPGQEQAATEPLDGAFHQLVDSVNAWLSNVMSLPRAREAGAVLQSELRPGLIRSRTGLLGLDRRTQEGARLGFLAHLLLNQPGGSDSLGMQIDRALLSLPTPRGLRMRTAEAVEQTLLALPDDRPAKIAILQPGCGALLARILPRVVQTGAEIAVVDGDPQTLAFVDAGLQARPAGVALRMIHADLSTVGDTGLSALPDPQDVIIVDGLVDHLPSRLVGPLLAVLKEALAPRGLLVLTAMLATPDARFMDHLLAWPLMRRDPADLLGLFRASELRPKIVCSGDQTDHGGLVITAVRADTGQDS
jgi:hypothetical protein